MNRSDRTTLTKYVEQKRRQRWRKNFVKVLACVVVCCTTYALILPGVTMEREPICGVDVHVHDVSCYAKIDTVSQIQLVCDYESLGVHRHDEDCLDDEDNLICGRIDFIAHAHNSLCFDANNALQCTLPEIEAHEHTEECYAVLEPVEPHVHNENCFVWELDGLSCGSEESEGHSHSEACYAPGALTCGQEETEGHVHGEACFKWKEVCVPTDETHEHTQGCYQVFNVCGLEEMPAHSHGPECYEWVVACGMEESEGHRHSEECYVYVARQTCLLQELTPDEAAKLNAENIKLICGLPEVSEHIHTESCLQEVEVPAEDADTLTCGLEEDSAHAHSDLCYGTWVNTCGIEAHSHTEQCYPEPIELSDAEVLSDDDTAPTYYCGLEAHTHGEGCWDDAGNLICQLTDHVHSEGCLVEPTPVEPTPDEPDSDEPDSDEPDSDEPDSDEPDSDEPDPDEPDSDEPDSDEPDPDEPDSDEPDSDEPDSDEPDSDEPDSDEPDSDEPDPDEPDPDEPDSDEPDSDEPTYYCGFEAHTHGEGCWDDAGNLVCQLTDHVHSEGCLVEPTPVEPTPDEPTYYCGFEAHTHGEGCWDDAGNLVCQLTEHVHSEGCLVESDPEEPTPDEPTYYCGFEAHTHGEGCWDDAGNLVCQLTDHVHSEGCLVEPTPVEPTPDEPTYYCGFEAHTHGEGCWDDAGNLVCQLTEHVHSEECLVESDPEEPTPDEPTYYCGFEAHTHGEGCWDATGNLVCQLTDHVHSEDCLVAPTYYCGLEAHTHGEGCWDDAGNLICQLTDHVHSEECLVAPTYYCGLEAHTHGEGCWDDAGNLICLLEQHVHTEDCMVEKPRLEIPDCDCFSTQPNIGDHADTCAKKAFFINLAIEKSAQELFDLWIEIPEDAQELIITYLTNNSYIEELRIKKEELLALIAGLAGGITAELPDGSKFVVSGDLPEGASLVVEDPQCSEEFAFSFLNPNMWGDVHKYWVYDIKIHLEDGQEYQPEQPVTVTVSSPEFQVTKDEYFYVSHLDAENGKVLGNKCLDLVDNSASFETDGFSYFLFTVVDKDIDGGERVWGTNWMKLRDSGYFSYWKKFLTSDDDDDEAVSAETPAMYARAGRSAGSPSGVQVDNAGGSNQNAEKTVSVSKTISGTELENVFDIKLTVTTQEKISTIVEEPDMAVVIVMDISNTMNNNFSGTTRYKAAMDSAEAFLDDFAANAGEVSKIGYVAFNTSAHQIFGLSECSSEAQAIALKDTMRTATGTIINAEGYGDAHTRFTNVEAGLKMGYDMLKNAPNKNKYIIFLSDGFPTTYVSSGYTGHDPYENSLFMDGVRDVRCTYGTSYSDTAARKAREMATEIKNHGTKIFSIGVDVGGQTIQQYINGNFDNNAGKQKYDANGKPIWDNFSVVECGDGSYTWVPNGAVTYNYNFEIGSASSKAAYQNWLKNSIGSGYYYDSTDSAGLHDAYEQIFAEIDRINQESSAADWVAEDPMPVVNEITSVEFIGFYNKNGELMVNAETGAAYDLTGSAAEGAEDTAVYHTDDTKIDWDLKNSGYTTSTSGEVTTYSYDLLYRVRLKNEADSFVESDGNGYKSYETNGTTKLAYKTIENGVIVKQADLEYPIPSVHGYLADLEFKKVDSYGVPLKGIEFTLAHDTSMCAFCRGDNVNYVSIDPMVGVTGADGKIAFTGIPSGHEYSLTEGDIPDGYASNGYTYRVTVAYDELTMTVTDKDGNIIPWDYETIVNVTSYELPNTGGPGTTIYILAGLVLVMLGAACIMYKTSKSRREVG